jgi:hypothetical protein
MRRTSGTASRVAVISSCWPAARPSPAFTAIAARRSSFCSKLKVSVGFCSGRVVVFVVVVEVVIVDFLSLALSLVGCVPV